MSENGISHLQYKRQRQEAKLKLAAEKRVAQGHPRSTLKKGNMPTLYKPGNNNSGDLKTITTGTLKVGRPFI
ncbi:MAG: hypothetical protein CMA64_08545 [Euryarchaeota archaeon]|jgi:hypothetical protein|nr:hypothetical protein [Euryarchaeota archaeon]